MSLLAGHRGCSPSMGSPASILVVDDDPLTTKNLRRILAREGHRVTVAATGREALQQLDGGRFDLVLTDLVLGDVDGLEILKHTKSVAPATEVIVITGHGSVQSAVEAMSLQAFHYLLKPLRAEEVRHLAGQALDKRRLRAEVSLLRTQIRTKERPIVGASPKIVELRQLIGHVAATEANVLITGESGTGKELVARAVHQASGRADQPFVAINCASFTEDLLANELFGHEKDAFTGASSLRKGLLETADGGTVFFDEVGDMSAMMQAKLLRAVQERELIRVGGSKPIQVDVRIIAATNKDLKKSVRLGTFRQDLYYRLAVLPVHVPRLNQRREDVPVLARHFLDRFGAGSTRAVRSISRAAMEVLQRYDYPGNVRELENLIERAAALARSDVIDVEDLPEDLREIETFTFHQSDDTIKSLAEVELEYIDWVLERCGRNKSRAADMLGINRVSLYRKLKKAQLSDE